MLPFMFMLMSLVKNRLLESTQVFAFEMIFHPYVPIITTKFHSYFNFSAPINSPTNLKAHNISSRVIQVRWNYDDDARLVLGVLQGFTLYVEQANAIDVFTDNGQLLTYARGVNRSTLIDGLKIFTLYNISIVARNSKGVGPTSESVIVRTRGEGLHLQPISLCSV